jgi:hypothetical protein
LLGYASINLKDLQVESGQVDIGLLKKVAIPDQAIVPATPKRVSIVSIVQVNCGLEIYAFQSTAATAIIQESSRKEKEL